MPVHPAIPAAFTPRFRSLDDDEERLIDCLIALKKEGALPLEEGQSLSGRYLDDANAWLMDVYVENCRFDLIEAHVTPRGEAVFGPPGPRLASVIARMTEAGETARAQRLWRAHIAAIKPGFWFYVGERDKGFRMARFWAASEAEQRKVHEALVAAVPEHKATMLAVLAEARAYFVATDAPAPMLAWLDAEIATVEAETRPKPGKPDPRTMDIDVFWETIEAGSDTMSSTERLAALPDRIARFKASAIKAFQKQLRAADQAAYRGDIWALAYLLQRGCSDDAFTDFRAWLILQGRAVYEATLADPNAFDLACWSGPPGEGTALFEAAHQAHQVRTGKPMPEKLQRLKLAGPDLDEEQFAQALPRIAELVA